MGDLIGNQQSSAHLIYPFFTVAEQENLKAELAKHELNKKSIVDEMNVLKKQLYAKFGDQIHLERE